MAWTLVLSADYRRISLGFQPIAQFAAPPPARSWRDPCAPSPRSPFEPPGEGGLGVGRSAAWSARRPIGRAQTPARRAWRASRPGRRSMGCSRGWAVGWPCPREQPARLRRLREGEGAAPDVPLRSIAPVKAASTPKPLQSLHCSSSCSNGRPPRRQSRPRRPRPTSRPLAG